MITLNTEKGLVRISSWDDVLTRPGFTINIDPKKVKLKSIIGSYNFDSYLPCGLSTCHQPHGKGFLVVVEDGRETNIGRICGKRHFSVDFTQMSRAFLVDLRAAQHRELLLELKSRLPAIRADINSLRHGEYGAAWINTQISCLIGSNSVLPHPITNAVKNIVRQNDGAITIERERTDDERTGVSTIIDAAGRERRAPWERFIRETVGQLEGFAALAPVNNLRALLVDTLDPFVLSLEEVEIDQLSNKQLRQLAAVGAQIDKLLERLRDIVANGRRLLRQSNIQQLKVYITSSADKRSLMSFLQRLPAGP